jgi:hypothetical protein
MRFHLLGQPIAEGLGVGFGDEFVFDGELAEDGEGFLIGGEQFTVLGLAEEEVELEGFGVFDADDAAEEFVGFLADALGAGEVKGEGLQAVPEAVFPGMGKSVLAAWTERWGVAGDQVSKKMR